MGTEIATAKSAQTKEEMLNLMQPVRERLGLQASQENEALIAFELEVVSVKLDRFGWPSLADAMKYRLTSDWVAVLGKYDVREVRKAIASFLKVKSKVPTEYEVEAEILRYRKKAINRAIQVAPEPEPKKRVTAEAAAEILAGAGFAPKTFGGTNQ